MKKNQYIVPAMQVTTINVADGILLSASDGKDMLGNGGTTEDGDVTESDAKGNSYNIWDISWE